MSHALGQVWDRSNLIGLFEFNGTTDGHPFPETLSQELKEWCNL